MRLLIFLVFLLMISIKGIAQQAGLDGPRLLYKKQHSKSFFVTSRGWGINYRTGKHITGKSDGVFEFDFTTFRHPKEIRTRSEGGNNRSYVLGKMNNLVAIRAGYGIQRSLYGKELAHAVEVKWNLYAGVSLGLAKPVFLEIRKSALIQGESFNIDERYNPDIHRPSNIAGRSPWYRGLNEIRPHPGGYLKSSFSFDFADEDDRMKFLETGMVLDFFLPPIQMMAENPANAIFLSFFLAYNFGSKQLN
jgi:hypothetical protein